MKLFARIEVILTFSREEVEYLMNQCKHHYSDDVQRLIVPGDDAFVHGMNIRLWNRDSVDYNLTFRQVDLLSKAVQLHYGKQTAAGMELNIGLQRKFFKACEKMNELGKPINDLLEIISK